MPRGALALAGFASPASHNNGWHLVTEIPGLIGHFLRLRVSRSRLGNGRHIQKQRGRPADRYDSRALTWRSCCACLWRRFCRHRCITLPIHWLEKGWCSRSVAGSTPVSLDSIHLHLWLLHNSNFRERENLITDPPSLETLKSTDLATFSIASNCHWPLTIHCRFQFRGYAATGRFAKETNLENKIRSGAKRWTGTEPHIDTCLLCAPKNGTAATAAVNDDSNSSVNETNTWQLDLWMAVVWN